MRLRLLEPPGLPKKPADQGHYGRRPAQDTQHRPASQSQEPIAQKRHRHQEEQHPLDGLKFSDGISRFSNVLHCHGQGCIPVTTRPGRDCIPFAIELKNISSPFWFPDFLQIVSQMVAGTIIGRIGGLKILSAQPLQMNKTPVVFHDFKIFLGKIKTDCVIP